MDFNESDLETPGRMRGFQGIFQACSTIVDQIRKKQQKSNADWKALEMFSGLQGLLFQEILEKSRDPNVVTVMKEFIERNENDLPPKATRIAKNMHSALTRIERSLSKVPEGIPVQDFVQMMREGASIESTKRMAEYSAQMEISLVLFRITKNHQVSLADIAKKTGIPLPGLAEASDSRAAGTAGLDLKEVKFIGEMYDTPVHLTMESHKDAVQRFFEPIDLDKIMPRQERLTEAELEELPGANLGPVVSLTQVRTEREKSQRFSDALTQLGSGITNLSGDWFTKIESGEHTRTALHNIDSLVAAMSDIGRGVLDEAGMRQLIQVSSKYFDFTARHVIGMYDFEMQRKLIPLTLRFSQMNLQTQHWTNLFDGTVSTQAADTLGLIVATVNYLNREITSILEGQIKTEYGHVRVAMRKLEELVQALRGVLPEEVSLSDEISQ